MVNLCKIALTVAAVLLWACASHGTGGGHVAASDVDRYQRHISAVLPPGWTIRREDASTLIVTREREIRGEIMAPSMPVHGKGQDRFGMHKVTIGLTIVPKITPAERAGLEKENKEAIAAWAAAHPRHHAEKPLMPPQKHRLATHYDERCSVVLWSLYAGPPAAGICFEFASREEAAECQKVFSAIEGMFRRYDAEVKGREGAMREHPAPPASP